MFPHFRVTNVPPSHVSIRSSSYLLAVTPPDIPIVAAQNSSELRLIVIPQHPARSPPQSPPIRPGLLPSPNGSGRRAAIEVLSEIVLFIRSPRGGREDPPSFLKFPRGFLRILEDSRESPEILERTQRKLRSLFGVFLGPLKVFARLPQIFSHFFDVFSVSF